MNTYLLSFIALIFSFFLQAQNQIANDTIIKLKEKQSNKLRTEQNSPVDLVQKQLEAYNSRNIEDFLSPYDDNIEAYYLYQKGIAFKGKKLMREKYLEIFKNSPKHQCILINRIIHKKTVIDKELVQFEDKSIEVIVIYQIENEKIKKIYFVN